MTTLPDPPEVDWAALEALIAANGITIDRPRHTAHPRFPEVVYPLDYGAVNGTVGEDGDPIDVFVGSGPPGLVAATRTIDRRKGDTEMKLLYGCTPEEVYMVHGFLNFAPELMTARLLMRGAPQALWDGFVRGGEVHHIELYVRDLAVSAAFWAPFLAWFGYHLSQEWPAGRSYMKGRTYVVLVQAEPAHKDAGFHRKRPGLNHLAFTAPSREAVDAFVAGFLAPRGLPLLYGGMVDEADGYYAAFFEDPDRLKVEVVHSPAKGPEAQESP